MTGDTDRDKLPEGSDELRNANGMARRRLVRSALAAPVVLSSLASKPVLGAEAYHCTVSGQLSGNVSAHPGDVICAARSVRAGPSGLIPHSWTSDHKGDLPNASGDGNTSQKSSSSSNWNVVHAFQRLQWARDTFYYSKSSSAFRRPHDIDEWARWPRRRCTRCLPLQIANLRAAVCTISVERQWFPLNSTAIAWDPATQ